MKIMKNGVGPKSPTYTLLVVSFCNGKESISKMVNLLTLLMISTSFHDNSISRYDKNIRITKFIKNTTFLAGLQNFTKIIYYNKS